MMTNHWRRRTLTLGVLAVGVPAAAFLTMTAAFADEFDFTPEISSFQPSQVEGFPPLINEVTGAEQWGVFDLTSNTDKFTTIFTGTDTQTTIGSFTNDDYLTDGAFLASSAGGTFVAPGDTQIDIANFGGGFENEWIDIPVGQDAGTSDLLITPFGDFELFGTAFSELSAAIG